MPSHANELVHETSPYLLQHAHNPVNWHAWGPRAFDLARQQGKPIFLSIGYSTCYWCHVMERQSFENEAIAAVMNEHFVNIKVDREERPDVDDIYMTAVQMFTGHGGWPMSMFLTPPGSRDAEDRGLKPFYAGTYFPPEPARGMTGFPQLLEALAKAWRERRDEVLEQAEQLAQHVRDHLEHRDDEAPPAPPGVDVVQSAATRLLRTYDPEHGGFGSAPKFPQPANLLFLLHVYQNNPNAELWNSLHHTLDRMARGGMYDQIGGGFHRYSTDERWLVPHFEKMLYDNGQLVEAYCIAHTIAPPADDPGFYQRVVAQTCDYVLREMTDDTGAFWSAQDAEVDAREGGNYVWTADEVRAALGDADHARLALTMYGLDAGPNFHDPHHPDATPVNVLFLPRHLHEVAQKENLALAELLQRKAEIDRRLMAVRDRRKQPGTDDKVLVAWNGLMIAGLARAGRTFNESGYTHAAARAADAILTHMRDGDDGLFRSMRQSAAKIPAFLEDYAFLIHGLLEMHRANHQPKWRDAALEMLHAVNRRFAARHGGYFDTRADQADLFVRTRGSYDGAVPAGNSQMVHNLVNLHELTGEQAFLEQAAIDLASFSQQLRERPTALLHMQHALLRAAEAAPATFSGKETAPAPGSPGRGRRAGAVQVSVDRDTLDLTSADSAELNVTIDIHREYHLNAHHPAPGFENLTPTRLELTNAAGLALNVEYPPGHEKKYPFADAAIRVYEKQAILKATLRRTDQRPAGPAPKLLLSYQVCTDHSCLEPKTVELPVKINA